MARELLGNIKGPKGDKGEDATVEERQFIDDSDLTLPNWLDLYSNNSFYDSKGIYINIELNVNDTFTDDTGEIQLIFFIEPDDYIGLAESKEIYKVTNSEGLAHSDIFNVLVVSASGYGVVHMLKNNSLNENVSIGDSFHFSCYVVKR